MGMIANEERGTLGHGDGAVPLSARGTRARGTRLPYRVLGTWGRFRCTRLSNRILVFQAHQGTFLVVQAPNLSAVQ
jgi:hypothetical protein